MARVGMAVNVPQTNADRQNLANLADMLEDLAFASTRVGLWFEGREAAVVFSQLANQVREAAARD